MTSDLGNTPCPAMPQMTKITRTTAPNGYSLLVVGVPQSGGLCKLYPPTPPLRRPGHPVFWGGSQPCVPAAWLAERLLLAGDIESNPGPKPTLKTLSRTRTQPPTLTKYTSSSAQPPRTCPPPLSLVHPPPQTPTSTPKYFHFLSTSPTVTPYTLDRIQPTRPDSLHISPSHKLPYVATQQHPPQPLTSPHPHTPTHETNKRPPKQNTKI